MKKNVRSLLAILLVAVMLISVLASCGKKDETADPGTPAQPGASATPPPADNAPPAQSDDRELTVIISGDSGSLHPHAASAAFNDPMRHIYDAPFDPKLDGTLEWLLVSEMDTISDIQYTLHLREGVTFQNGNPFTAEDFVFSMELARDNTQFFLQVKAVDFEKTNIIDDYTVDLWLTQYDVGCFSSMMLLYMFDKESYDEVALAEKPNGTGPYVVVEYVANSHLTVERREDYWGGPAPIKRINFLVINEQSQRVNAILTGDADFSDIPMKDIEFVESLGTHTIKKGNFASSYTAYLNVTPSDSNPLGTLEARKAVMHAIDRQALVDMVLSGQSTLPAWPLSEGALDFEPRFANMSDVYSTGYDPVKAKEYADRSGLTGKSLRIITNGDATFVAMAEVIQSNLKEIGVNAEIKNYDAATYFSLLMDESNFEIALFLLASTPSVAIDMLAMYPQFIPLGWSGPERDRYIEIGMKGLGTPDAAVRSDILYEMLGIFDNNHPWFALAEAITPSAISNEIGGVEFYLGGSFRCWHWYFTD
ncbi:MAG: ABC transporter substrate-binding protein [Oscillospiraceae bacterium]|jgi:peptide/nickel transport system substrate-binding protein|nr:ABC transporter substrate-binding protein [Oscillospiraceae bacterium]